MSVGTEGVFITYNHAIGRFITIVITMTSMMALIGCELLITNGALGAKEHYC